MSHEIPETTKEEITPMDLVSKKLFESGIQQLELSIHTVESNLVMARGMLLQTKLLEDPQAKQEVENRIAEDTKLLKEAKEQLISLYSGLAATIDRKLLGALREHVIRGQNGLNPDEKKQVLDKIRENR